MQGRGVAVLLAAVLTTTATAAGTLVVTRSGEALPGTTVAGRDVSGQDAQALRATVEGLAQQVTTGTLAVTAAGTAAQVERSLVTVDVPATIARALAVGRGDVPFVGELVGRGGEVELDLAVDQPGLRAAVQALAAKVDRPVDDGGFSVVGTAVDPRQPVEGRTVETAQAVAVVEAALREGRPTAELPVDITAPTTTPDDVDAVVAAASAALSSGYALGTGNGVLRVTPAQFGPLLRAVPVAGALELQVDGPGLTAAVQDQAEQLEVGSSEAGFTVLSSAPTVDAKGDLAWTPQPAQVQVRPGAAGREVDLTAATAALTSAIVAADSTTPRPLPVTVVEPELTTAAAEGARVRTLIGTFTTYYPAGAPRARNIQRIAELVDDTYVPAGEVLSLNKAAGPRTLRRGFVADGAIVDGELTDEVGGGVSQFATTLFNAAFFAGLPIREHKPHSFYIGRYPAGRESTVYFGAIDVKVANDTGNGLLVRTRSTAGSVTVELYGENGGRRVTSTSSPRTPRPDGGFRVAVTRSITGGDGVGKRRVFTTSYDPVPPDRREAPR